MFQNTTGCAKDRVLCDKCHTCLPDEPRTQKSTSLLEAGLSEFILCEESKVWSEVNEGLLSQMTINVSRGIKMV